MERDINLLDRIFIRDLLLRCILGINPEERVKKRDVIINITLYADLAPPSESDSIDDTVDYRGIKDTVVNLVENSSFLLIESMAGAIADSCLAHPLVQAARVCVDKPGALRFARSVAVEVFRYRPA